MITLPPPDRMGEPEAALCALCAGELYRGEEFYRIDGQVVCPDCLPRFAEAYFGLCRITGGSEEHT